MTNSPLITSAALADQLDQTCVLDCRFSLADSSAGLSAYREGHIPGAHYLHLEEDMSGPKGEHGGRHPLPEPMQFAARIAQLGVGLDTPVVVYDDSRFAFASRAWWMMRSLGYRRVKVLDGGLAAWLGSGGVLSPELPIAEPVAVPSVDSFQAVLDIEGVRSALAHSAVLVDSREERRYLGLEEPIDPVAGHIPGAVNYPWQEVTDSEGMALSGESQAERWAELEPGRDTVVYCGSGVTACVNLLSMAIAGFEGARLYAGSWSDWCSYLENSADGD